MKAIFKKISPIIYLVLSTAFSLLEPAIAPSKPVFIKLTLQEAQIIQQILEQIELTIQEVAPYLAIVNPLDQLLATTLTQEPSKQDKQLILRLTLEATNNLLLFLQRANIPALGAKQIDNILKGIEKSLPTRGYPAPNAAQKPALVTLHLTQVEATILQQLLAQIAISIPEVEPFLLIYIPLEQEILHIEGTDKDVIVTLPEVALGNLSLFLERARITGQQAKIVYSILEKLQRLATAVIRTHNNDQPSSLTP